MGRLPLRPGQPCEKLGEIEASNLPMAMIGKPCDIAAATKAAKFRPKLKENLALTISIFCAGTPSLAGTLDLLRKMGVNDPNEVTRFRYRGRGWPGSMKAESRDERRLKEISYSSGWGDTLQKYRQWRCHVCADHSGELADLSIGDPWHRPVDGKDMGRSMILVRTERGRNILHAAIEAGYLKATACSPEAVDLAQRHLLRTRGAVWGRLLAMRLAGLRTPRFPGMEMFKIWRNQLSLRDKVGSILGTFRRLRQKHLHQPERVTPVNHLRPFWQQNTD